MRLGMGGSSLFSGCGLFERSVIWAMKKFGPRWREKMDKTFNDEGG